MDEKEAEAHPVMGTIFLVSSNFLQLIFTACLKVTVLCCVCVCDTIQQVKPVPTSVFFLRQQSELNP